MWAGASDLWFGERAVFLIIAVAVAVVAVAVALGVRRVHRGGETVRGASLRRRQRARALVDSADKLHALAPVAAGLVTLASFPAALLALVAAPRAGGGHLPPSADARLQLYCIAAGVLVAVVGLDCWYGIGISMRAVTTDGFTLAVVVFGIALVPRRR